MKSNTPDGGVSRPPSDNARDPLSELTGLPGVEAAVNGMRTAVDRVYGHRVMRRRSAEVTMEAALRAARASASLAGADWALEEVRRRTDFSADREARTVGAALRVTAEAGQLLDIWRASPLRVLARLHLVAVGPTSDGAPVGRPRLAGEALTDHDETGLPLPAADEVAARLSGLNDVLTGGSDAPALVLAAVVHGELQALRPFTSFNGLVARTAERLVLITAGLDPKAVAPPEVGHAELGATGYRRALADYAAGSADRMAAWIGHCGNAVRMGARESVAVCEAMQRGAA